MKVVVKGYDLVKYDEKSKKVFEVEYEITGFEVKEISKEEILTETDESGIDEYNEYLILHFGNGETSTFRNSHCDLFKA